MLNDFTTAGRTLAAFGTFVVLVALFAPEILERQNSRLGAAAVGVAAILIGAVVVSIGG